MTLAAGLGSLVPPQHLKGVGIERPEPGRTAFSKLVSEFIVAVVVRDLSSRVVDQQGGARNRMVAKLSAAADTKPASFVLAKSISEIAVKRDQSAFELLFRYFAPRVKSYCIRLGADPSLAEEITQETMVAVWRNASQFDSSKASASTWIFTIARNLSIDRFRQSRRPRFDPADPAFVPDEAVPPDIMLEKTEMDGRVRDIMESLSSSERSVLMLSFYENFSHGEIAKQLNLPLGTVKSRIRLAFAKLRSRLDASDGAGEQ